MEKYKQVIIARKDLNMSPGKLAAQVSHASMAFLTTDIRKNANKIVTEEFEVFHVNKNHPYAYFRQEELNEWAKETVEKGEDVFYVRRDPNDPYKFIKCEKEDLEYLCHYETFYNVDLFDNWINGTFTKVICGAKNLDRMMKAVEIAKELGLEEGKDYFIIKDNCYTELEPEEFDAEGVGRCITCVGFAPLPESIANQISKKFQLY